MQLRKPATAQPATMSHNTTVRKNDQPPAPQQFDDDGFGFKANAESLEDILHERAIDHGRLHAAQAQSRLSHGGTLRPAATRHMSEYIPAAAFVSAESVFSIPNSYDISIQNPELVAKRTSMFKGALRVVKRRAADLVEEDIEQYATPRKRAAPEPITPVWEKKQASNFKDAHVLDQITSAVLKSAKAFS